MRNRLPRAAVVYGFLFLGALPVAGRELPFNRADVNQDGILDVSDPINVLFYLYLPLHEVPCEKAADVNDSGAVDLSDAIYALSFLFANGPPPPPPFGACGPDPSSDELTCAQSPCEDDFPLLELAADCSADPEAQLGWIVTNREIEPVTLDWEIEGSAQSGVVQVPALDSIVLTTDRVSGVNVLVLYYAGQEKGRLAHTSIVISEVMASNAETLADKDGDSSDWIEIHMVNSPCALSVDMEGWYLTDDEADLTKWQFPSVTLETGGYLVVFASGKDETGSELHANFRLDDDGEYLALVAADGVTVVDEFAPTYPEQLTDVSYGVAQWTATLVKPGDDVLYHVPSAGDAGLGDGWADPGYEPSGWSSGTTGLGFSGIATEGFEVTYIKANVRVEDLADADDVLHDPGKQSQVVSETAAFIDYFNTGGRGNYTNDDPFPGIGFSDVEDFVVYVTGTVLIPDAGAWSFGVNSDDGFSLELTNGVQRYTMSHPSPRGPADTIEVFNITRAGPYELTLLFFERGGGSELELFAAQGNHPSFSYDHFRLVGDTENGGLGLLGFAANIETDVGGEMKNANASIWARIGFAVDDADVFGGLSLRMKYEDGFVAYLNGEEVARRNAPGSVAWNSTASEDRPVEDVPVLEEINLTSHLGLLENGPNVLAIHGLNDSAADGDFLILPELIAASRASERQYMSTPTPGEFNVAGAVDFVRNVVFSVDRGFYDAPFQLTLTTPTVGAVIRYTLNGSTPTSTSGILYNSPLRVGGTTVVRAAAFKPEHLDSEVHTRTYIFVSDVIRQSPNGQAPGSGWPTGSVNGQVLDYGMDPDIVNNPRWAGQIEDALLGIPSISLVTDLANLFHPSTGIYVNARNDGRAWERRTSVELIHPDGTEGFGLDAGLRIRGAFSRSGGNPKHALRLIFRNEYGDGKLDYPLFGGEGVDRFDKIDLRTSQNNSWAFQGSSQNTLIRDVFSRDVQREMHQPYTRSRYYHVYINGHYWGVFQTQERADADFASSYLGGRDDDYDVIKNDSSGSRALQATDGTMDAYRRLYDAAVVGFTSDAAYFRVLGLKPDGTPDENGERLLDPENLMDYMICTYYTGDPDAPVSCWAHFSNNVFAIYNHTAPEGFTWYRHDAEHSLGANGGVTEARLLTDSTDRSIGEDWRHFNPAWLNLRLTMSHPEYRLEFADRVNMYFSNGGLLSAGPNIERWLGRAREIELAIIAESARWGDAKTNPPLTKDHWEGQNNYMVNTFFPQRTQIVINNMRAVNMFPSQAIVSFNQHGGEVEPGFRLLMSQQNGTPGTIYYTLDGIDPREWGGGTNPDAEVFEDETSGVTLIARGSTWRYKDDGSNQGTAWRELNFPDGGWDQGRAQLGYGDGDEATVVGFGPDDNNKYPTTYFRHEFNVTDASEVIQLTLGLVRDDGAVVYLNDVEAAPRSNMPGGAINYLTWAEGPGVPVGGADESTFLTFDVDPGLLVDGPNIMAVEIHQESGTSSDISFDLELTALTAGVGSPAIALNETTTVMARVRNANGWGALTEARFTVGLEGLVINELMASNQTTLEDPDEPGEFPDWLEVYNGTPATIDLGGMYLTDDMAELTHWQIAEGVSIAPGEHLIFYADDDGTQGVYHTDYQLSQSGETIALVDRDGKTIIDSILFDSQLRDVSYGRYPDGAETWGFHQSPTPGTPNDLHTP